MKKRIVAALLLVAMLLSLLTACGGNDAPAADVGANAGNDAEVTPNSGDANAVPGVGNFTVPAGGYDGSEVTLAFYHTMGASLREVLDIYIAEFNEIYPNIHIEHSQVGSYDDVRDQVSKEITAGAQPNIAYCYPDHVALYNLAAAVTTLDGFIDSQESDGNGGILGLTQEQKDDFIKGFYDEGAAFGDGLMYTLPMSKSTEVLYYNKTFFEKHGLEVPKTWDDMEKLCADIKAIDPECIPLGYDSSANWFITMCEQYGSPYTSATGDHFLFNNEQNRAFIEKFNSWYQMGYLTTQDLYGAYTSGLFTATTGTKSYMSIGSTGGATHQQAEKDNNGDFLFEVGIATMPQVDPANPKVISQGPSLCIFQKENPQEVIASWLFVKFLTTNINFQAEFSMTSGYMPVLKSVSQHPVYTAEFSDLADGYEYIAALATKVAMEQEAAYYTSPAFNGSSTARDQVGFLLNKCLAFSSKEVDIPSAIESAFEDAIDECEYGI